MKKYVLFAFIALFFVSSHSWAQYVKVTAEDGTVSWIEIEGTINGTEIEIYKRDGESAIDYNTMGSIDLNEVWSLSDGKGTQYQVTSIGSFAFYECRGLTSITIPNSVTSIGDYAFDGCRDLTSIDVPNSVTSIGIGAFSYCSSLTSVTIGNSVTSIGESAFGCCTGLTSIEIPSSVTSIGVGAFSSCFGLTSITIPNSVTSIGKSAFYRCFGLTSIEIPSSVTNIEDCTFFDCSGLICIVIPSSVTSIGYYAFYGCSGLTSVTIPNSVTSIGYYAFSDCSGLTSVISYITEVFETGQNAFYGCDNATLYVPRGKVDTYNYTADWYGFSKIEEIPDIGLAMSCNNKGKVIINSGVQFTNDMGEVRVYDGVDNTFIFQPKENYELRQVLIDGLDVTLSVENNQLTTKVHEGSKMMIIFDKTGYDVNGDGNIDISDVVALVNMILGQ